MTREERREAYRAKSRKLHSEQAMPWSHPTPAKRKPRARKIPSDGGLADYARADDLGESHD